MQGEFGLALSRAGGLGLGEMLAKALRPQQADGARVMSTGTARRSPAAAAGPPATAGDDRDMARAAAAASGATRPRPTAGDRGGGDRRPSAGAPTRSPARRGSTRAPTCAAAYGSPRCALRRRCRDLRPVTRSGYGLTVVVDHGDGRETLLGPPVVARRRAGDQVRARGQPIARSGNSGRATGAHLHFEARESGRPVDPGGRATWNGRTSDTVSANRTNHGCRY